MEIQANKEDLLNKILDVMSKLAKSERLWAEAEQNTKAISERKDALEKELEETKKAFAEKSAELEAISQANDVKLQRVYNQGQHDFISFCETWGAEEPSKLLCLRLVRCPGYTIGWGHLLSPDHWWHSVSQGLNHNS